MGYYPWINRNYVKAAMLAMAKHGVSRQDRWAAALTGAWIKAFHAVCIVGSHPYAVTLHQNSHPEYFIAECMRFEFRDEYRIYTPRLAVHLMQLATNLSTRGARLARIHRAAIALAAHEVRHMAQFQIPTLRLFVPTSLVTNLQVQFAITCTSEEMTARKIQMIAQKRPAKVIEICTNGREFDAQVIENLVHVMYPEQKTFADLCRLIMTEPQRS